METNNPVKPVNVLVIDDNAVFLKFCELCLKSFCSSVFTAVDATEAEIHLDEHSMDLIIVDIDLDGQSGVLLGNNLRYRYPSAAVCLWTASMKRVQEQLNYGMLCFLKPSGKYEKHNILQPLMHFWYLRNNLQSKYPPLTGVIKLIAEEPQKDVLAQHYQLLRDQDPGASFVGAVMRHDFQKNDVNLSAGLGGCPAGCLFCNTAKCVKTSLKLTSLEYAEQVSLQLRCYKAFGALNGKIRISDHSGRDPRFSIEEYCGGVEIIDSWGLDTHHICTSIGGLEVFEKLVARLGDNHKMSFELSMNAADENARGWFMPITKGEKLQPQIDFLANDGEKNNRRNKVRELLFGGLNDTEREADRIEKRMRGRKLRMIVTKANRVCLPRYPKIFTDKEALHFVKLLVERGIDAYFNENLGDGLVVCGEHVSIFNRLKFEKFYGKDSENF